MPNLLETYSRQIHIADADQIPRYKYNTILTYQKGFFH